jgi:hypothetical protein
VVIGAPGSFACRSERYARSRDSDLPASSRARVRDL